MNTFSPRQLQINQKHFRLRQPTLPLQYSLLHLLHLLVSGHKYENVWAQIGKAKIWESKTQKLLGVEIERTLNFDEHVKSLCKKAGRKLSVLSRLSSYMTVKQKKILMKSFFESQFGYCPSSVLKDNGSIS